MENNSKKAIIELSENKITLVILETKEPCFYNVIDTYSDNIALAQEIINENLIRPVVIKDVMKILKSYRKICDNLGIVNITMFAPNYFSKARNIKSLTEEIYNTCGFAINILSPEEQLKSLFCGAVNCTDLTKGVFLHIGEYETYIVQFNRRNILNSISLPFGTYPLAKMQEEGDKNEANKYLEDFAAQIKEIPFINDKDPETQYLTNGALFLNLGVLARKATRYPLELANNYVVTKETFDNVYNLVTNLDLDKTKKLKGISEGSADKFVAGLQLANIFMNSQEVPQFSISEEGLRDGYMNFYIMPEVFDRPLSEMFAYSLENINAFFKVPNSNNEKVYELAINVFKQLKVIHKLPRNYIKPLRIAAYMYDCGKRICYNNYIKNSFSIILNSKIKGVSQKDLLLAAFACTFQELDNFNLTEWVKYSSIVTEDDLDAIKKIGIIIKLAAALDSTKSSVIQDLSCDILGDSIIMKTIVEKDASFEISEAMKVNSSFKKVFVKFIEVI